MNVFGRRGIEEETLATHLPVAWRPHDVDQALLQAYAMTVSRKRI